MLHVNVRLFAGLYALVGERRVPLELPEGATIVELREALTSKYPAVRPFLQTLVCAVAEDYVPSSHVLQEGDEVALIPPVSGGC